MKFLLGFLLLFSLKTGEFKGKMPDQPNKIQDFLSRIAQIESQNGQNMNHPQIQGGIHTGDQAIGRYGLMPNTVSEVLNRMRMQGTITPELQQIQAMQHPEMKALLEKNPQLEDQIAQSLAQRVLTRQPDDTSAAYSWHSGTNLTPEQIAARPIQNNDYVKKYNELKNKPADEADEEDDDGK